MPNPCRAIREACETTYKSFSMEADVAVSVIQDVELGLYPDVSTHYSRSLGKLAYDHGVDASALLEPWATLNDAYHAWQAKERHVFWGRIITYPEFSTGDEISPMEKLRRAVAPTGLNTFCSMVKAPRAPLRTYESGKQATMPASIERALKGVNYPHIEALKDMQEKWLEARSSTITRS